MLYNAILFVIGIASIMGMEWLMDKVIPVGEDPIEPIAMALGVVGYGIMANLCYSLGWVVELVGTKTDADSARSRAQKQFILGLWLSCLLTTAPLWFGGVFWLTHRNH